MNCGNYHDNKDFLFPNAVITNVLSFYLSIFLFLNTFNEVGGIKGKEKRTKIKVGQETKKK